MVHTYRHICGAVTDPEEYGCVTTSGAQCKSSFPTQPYCSRTCICTLLIEVLNSACANL